MWSTCYFSLLYVRIWWQKSSFREYCLDAPPNSPKPTLQEMYTEPVRSINMLSLNHYPYSSQESGEGNTRTNPPLLEYSSRVWRNILSSSPVRPSSVFFLGPEDCGLEFDITAPPAVADRCLCKMKQKPVWYFKNKTASVHCVPSSFNSRTSWSSSHGSKLTCEVLVHWPP